MLGSKCLDHSDIPGSDGVGGGNGQAIAGNELIFREALALRIRAAPAIPSRHVAIGQCEHISMEIDAQEPQAARIAMAEILGVGGA